MTPVKKTFPFISVIIICVVVGFLISSALYIFAGFSLFGKFREKPLTTDDNSNADLCALAYRVLKDIENGDYAALSRVAHPENGVLFSPQATVDKSTNKQFSAAEIASFGTDINTYIWGIDSSCGEPIEMTPAEFFANFICCKDYSAAPVIGVNHIVRSGNALENITDVFPDSQFVEFHIPGVEQDPSSDFDWYTLRLGFEEYDGSLWLSVIIHSEWSE